MQRSNSSRQDRATSADLILIVSGHRRRDAIVHSSSGFTPPTIGASTSGVSLEGFRLVVCSATMVAPRLSAMARGSSLASSLLTGAPVYLSASRSQQPFGCGADSHAAPWSVIIGVWCPHRSGRRFRSAGGRLWALLYRRVTKHAAVSAGTGHFERIARGVR